MRRVVLKMAAAVAETVNSKSYNHDNSVVRDELNMSRDDKMFKNSTILMHTSFKYINRLILKTKIFYIQTKTIEKTSL